MPEKKHKPITPSDACLRFCQACQDHLKGQVTLAQLKARLAGQRGAKVLAHCHSPELSQVLFTLMLDFQSWYGDRDDIIERTVEQVVALHGPGVTNLANLH